MKIYTKIGDKGTTRTLTGEEVSKDSSIIHLNGAIDSLQSIIDMLIRYSGDKDNELGYIQTKLWQLGGEVSANSNDSLITTFDIKLLENTIDKYMDGKDLRGFVRFTKILSTTANEARVRTRYLERKMVHYKDELNINNSSLVFINRLGDYFFAYSVNDEDR